MATKTEMGIAVLVIIGIIVSASSLFYVLDLSARIAAIEEKLPPTLTIVGPWAGKELDVFKPVLSTFERLTGIRVKIRVSRAEDLAPILPAQFEAEKTPGDVIFMWAWFIKEKGGEGHMLDVTDLIDAADYLPGVLDPVNDTGTLWGAPYTGKVKPGFWYRKSFFTTNNLTVPTTWTEFTTLLEDINNIQGIVAPIASGDGVGWPLSDVTEYFIIAYGGPQLHRDLMTGEADWTDPEVKAVFEDRLVPLLTAGYFGEPSTWDILVDSWWAGDYGLYFMGSWITAMVPEAETDDLAFFPLPEAQEGLVFVGDYCCVPAYTEHPEEAKELLEFLSSKEAQRLQVSEGGHIATHKDVSLIEYPELDASIASSITGIPVLLDLDDTIGGEFQTTFWDQLKLLWVQPGQLDAVLAAIQAKAP